MGLPMDDIHTPSVPPGSVTDHSSEQNEVKDMSLMELITHKQRVEEELSALGSVLDSVSSGKSCVLDLVAKGLIELAPSSMAST